MCTYLADLELDIGKSARWVQWFVDSLFFYDANGGAARQYAVDYAKSWPDCQFAYHPGDATPYHTDPSVMRQMAFQAADKAWHYDPGDWVFFVDGTESLSTDVPHDALELLTPHSIRFRYLYDEAEAAEDAGSNFLAVPIRVFLNQGTVVEHTFNISNQLPPDDPANQAVWWSCSPHYLGDVAVPSPRNLMRFGKVSKLRTLVKADWQKMDTYSTYTPGTQHVSLISYSYARYSEVDYHDSSLWVEANDEGFQSRLFMQQVPGRNVPELPVVYATPDPAGSTITVPPGPAHITAFDNLSSTYLFDFTGAVTLESGNETYAWDFGDTTTGTGQHVSHTFPTIDIDPYTTVYTVVLTVADPDVGTPRTATVHIQPGATRPVMPQSPDAPSTPTGRMLSPAYCYYVNQAVGQYVMAFAALWRMNPRDGAWYKQMDIGTIPVSPLTGAPDLGVDVNGNPVDPVYWDVQQPQKRATLTPPNQTGPGI